MLTRPPNPVGLPQGAFLMFRFHSLCDCGNLYSMTGIIGTQGVRNMNYALILETSRKAKAAKQLYEHLRNHYKGKLLPEQKI